MLEHVVLYSYDRQIELAAHATILVWTALPGRLSNIQNKLSFLVDDALAAEAPGAEKVGLQVEGNLAGSLSNWIVVMATFHLFLVALLLPAFCLSAKLRRTSSNPSLRRDSSITSSTDIVARPACLDFRY